MLLLYNVFLTVKFKRWVGWVQTVPWIFQAFSFRCVSEMPDSSRGWCFFWDYKISANVWKCIACWHFLTMMKRSRSTSGYWSCCFRNLKKTCLIDRPVMTRGRSGTFFQIDQSPVPSCFSFFCFSFYTHIYFRNKPSVFIIIISFTFPHYAALSNVTQGIWGCINTSLISSRII